MDKALIAGRLAQHGLWADEQMTDAIAAIVREAEAAVVSRDRVEFSAACSKDAERYRWLRENCKANWCLNYDEIEVKFPFAGDEWLDLDDAIDLAMQEPTT